MKIEEEIKLVSRIKEIVHNQNAFLMNCYVSGSHLYGWDSRDSDTDIRGVVVLGKKTILSLDEYRDVIEVPKETESGYDIVLFDLKKAIKLALAGNCNILEEINAPQVYKTAEFVELKQLVNNAMGKKGLYESYRGMAMFNYKKFILQGRVTMKKYLYVFRGLMAGIYALQTGRIQPDINELNRYFKIKEVKGLVGAKVKSLENDLTDMDSGVLDTKIKDLFQKIDDAYIKCKMPETPTKEEREALNEFLVKTRLEK